MQNLIEKFIKDYRENLMDIVIITSGMFIILKMTNIYKTLASIFLIHTINYLIDLYGSCKDKDNKNISKYAMQSIITLVSTIYIYTNY